MAQTGEPRIRVVEVGARREVRERRGTSASTTCAERAKKVLVERRGVTLERAAQTLRARALSQRRSLDDVCADVIAWANGGRDDSTSVATARRADQPER